MKHIIVLFISVMLMSCSSLNHTDEQTIGYKMITAIGHLNSNAFEASSFESKGLINPRFDVEIYAQQDSIKIKREAISEFFKARSSKGFLKLSLINSADIIGHLNSEYSKLSKYIIDNPSTQMITEIDVFMTPQESKQILEANAIFLNKTQEGVYRVKTVLNGKTNYIPLNQENIFDFKSQEFCVRRDNYRKEIVALADDCPSVKNEKSKKIRYDRL